MAIRVGPVQGVRRWWLTRHTPSATLTLHHRNLYILPTRMGWMLAATLLLLLVASINDQLNLGYMLTFWLLGMAVVGMHLTHGNARGLRWTAPPTPCVATPVRRCRYRCRCTTHTGAALGPSAWPGGRVLGTGTTSRPVHKRWR